MCQHDRADVYYHVVDEDTGETIATYNNSPAAYARCAVESLENGRDFCTVATTGNPGPRSIYYGGHYYYPGELIPTETITALTLVSGRATG